MLNRKTVYIFLFFLLVLYSCSGVGVKYPHYKSSKSVVHKIQTKEHGGNGDIKTGLNYLKLKKCNMAIEYFRHLNNDFITNYCLAVSYGYCRMYKQSENLLSKIEDKTNSSRWKARVYASLGLVYMLNGKSGFRDYLTIAYAYDDNNRLAKSLMFKQDVDKTEKDRYFDIIFSWCGENDKQR